MRILHHFPGSPQPLCALCLGSDRRLPSVILPDGTVAQACCVDPGLPPAEDRLPFPLAVREWIGKLAVAPHESLTDEECALVVCLRLGYVPDEHVGLIVVATEAYERQKPQEPRSGLWVGEPGAKLERNRVQCLESRLLDPVRLDTGVTIQSTLVKFKTVEGEDLTWFASGKFVPEAGGTYDVKFTVKAHDLYEGHRSTLITRCFDSNAPKRKKEA